MGHSSLPVGGSVFLAPLAGFNDPAFRLVCGRRGAAVSYTEMISAEGLVRKQRRTLEMLATSPSEGPLAVQLFGARVQTLAEAARMVERELDDIVSPVLLDLNLGCSVRKVLRTGAGSALLQRPEKVGRIIAAMRAATDIPVSAKIRLGPSPERANYLKVARIVEDAGADMLAVHGRYADQGFSGDTHLSPIREICDSVDIPVAGNGDVVDGMTAEVMLRKTGCEYAMIGRAALGDQDVFHRVNVFLESGRVMPVRDTLEQFEEYYREATALGVVPQRIKKHAIRFIGGKPNSKKARMAVSRESNPEAILKIIRDHGAADE